jgi:hypothetical protein
MGLHPRYLDPWSWHIASTAPSFVKAIWGQTLGVSRPLVSNQTLTQRTSLIVIEVTSKVHVAWGLGTGFPYFIFGVEVCWRETPANAPAEKSWLHVTPNGVRESSAGYLQVWYGIATRVFHEGTWRQNGDNGRDAGGQGAPPDKKLALNPRGEI